MSKVCGIEVNGSDAIFVILEGCKNDFKIIKTKPLKIGLSNHLLQDDIKSFYKSAKDFFTSYDISSVLIKSGSTGKYSSGPAVFKIETLIQMMDAKIEFITSQTLAAYWKKVDVDISKFELLKYQHNAFKLAYHNLED